MAKVLRIKNPRLPDREQTFLTAKYTSGTTLTVKNNNNFEDNIFAVLGVPGREKTEIGKVASITGASTVTLDAALSFSHKIDTVIYRSEYDQISIERKASGGAYAQIAEGLVNIQWDEQDGNTKVSVAAGVDSDTYKWRFYNSLATTYSDYSGELPGSGLTQFHVGSMIKSIRYFGKMPAFKGITDIDILNSLNRGQREIDIQAPDGRWWFTLVEDSDTTRVTSVVGQSKYDLTSDFRAMDVIQVLDLNSQKYNLSYLPRPVYDAYKTDQSSTLYSDSTMQWTLLPPDTDNTVGYFGVYPTPATTGIYFYRRYWRYLPELTSFASKTLVPVPEVLVNYALYEIYRLREDRDNALFYYGLFEKGLKLIHGLQRRQLGQQQILNYRGQNGFANLFGNPGLQSSENIVTNYF